MSISFIHPSTHPSSPRRPLYRANVVSQETSVSSSSYYSPILDCLSIHCCLLVFIPPLFALWVSMFRDLCSVRPFFIFAFLWVCYDLPAIEYAAMPLLQKKPLIDFVYALSVFDLVSIPRSRNQLFPQSYDSCFQFRSVPSPLPFFSVVSTLYSSRYLPPRLLYNIVDTLFNPSLRLTSVFPAFSSAISSIFYQLAFVNVPSYSVPITFNLFPTRLFSSHPPSLARILANSR